ncbi:dihydrodipicolinate synthase family protein [Rubritalea tangerina]|uniref:Dihydrodipicolinate synthase family protein n=1 Tax=Rubritalea tangerina TaxID=430798 RepID=A0ABW4Z6Q8_9BACT
MNNYTMKGLVPAAYTPMFEDLSVNYDAIEAMASYLKASGVNAIFICGSTGEGCNLTTEERKKVAEAYVKHFDGEVIVHVGHNCLKDAADLAAHAQEIGAAAVSAIAPSYFPMNSTQVLLKSMKQIAAACPELPFYYYHIPALTNAGANVPEFLELAADSIPNLRGVKFTNEQIHVFLACKQAAGGIYDIAFGYDEMMIAGWSAGSKAYVGSTFNFMAPLYQALLDAAEAGNMEEARRLQHLSEEAIRVINSVGAFHPLVKTLISRLGVPCGPARLPMDSVTQEQADTLWNKLQDLGVGPYLNPSISLSRV